MEVLKEVLGTLYLGAGYFLFSRLFYYLREDLTSVLQTGLALCVFFASLLGLIAGLLLLLGTETALFYPYENYPYLGDVQRLKGFASSPNLFFSTLALSSIFLYGLDRKRYQLLALTSFVICFITFSKGLALMLLFLLFIRLQQEKRAIEWQTRHLFFFLLAGGLYLSLTWFTLRSNEGLLMLNQKLNVEQLYHESIGNLGPFSVHYTTHFALQRGSLAIINKHGWKGCGFGNYKTSIEQLKIDGQYPASFASYDPHSFYTAQIAELGIMSIPFILLLPFAIIKILYELRSLDPTIRNALLLALLFMTLESTCIGSLHFRHYWMILAVLNAFYLLKRDELAFR